MALCKRIEAWIEANEKLYGLAPALVEPSTQWFIAADRPLMSITIHAHQRFFCSVYVNFFEPAAGEWLRARKEDIPSNELSRAMTAIASCCQSFVKSQSQWPPAVPGC